MIDAQGFRANVGIILTNDEGRLFWAKRIGADAWQFPQGGIRSSETTEKAMYRELREETGLRSEQVEIIGCTRDWLRYRLPDKYIRRRSRPLCIGQKQLWYLLRLLADESEVNRPAAGIRSVALGGILGTPGRGHRLQARRL